LGNVDRIVDPDVADIYVKPVDLQQMAYTSGKRIKVFKICKTPNHHMLNAKLPFHQAFLLYPLSAWLARNLVESR
jgi:hypothetical protein